MKMKIQKFAELLESEQLRDHQRQGFTYEGHEKTVKVSIKPGPKYTKIDVGASGKYMVVNDTGEIFGIKAYGVINRDKAYGNLDTINEWYWGRYTAAHK